MSSFVVKKKKQHTTTHVRLVQLGKWKVSHLAAVGLACKGRAPHAFSREVFIPLRSPSWSQEVCVDVPYDTDPPGCEAFAQLSPQPSRSHSVMEVV